MRDAIIKYGIFIQETKRYVPHTVDFGLHKCILVHTNAWHITDADRILPMSDSEPAEVLLC